MRSFLGGLFLLGASFSFADNKSIASSQDFQSSVFSKAGNIYYSLSHDKTVQITHSNKDLSPLLSPNNKIIIFIREGTGPIVPQRCRDFADIKTPRADQIWIFNLKEKKERLLVKNYPSCDVPEKMIIDAKNLAFSPDSKILYFQTSAWATSGALHAVNIDGAHQRYIVPAEEFEIIPKGQYKGYLLVYDHRHFIGGGSYDWYWLVSPQGKEEGPIGPEVTADQREYLEANYN